MKKVQKSACGIVLALLLCHLNDLGQDKRNNRHISAKSIDFCKLFETRKYDERIVRTSAVLYIPAEGEPRVDGNSDDVFYSRNCNNKDYFAVVDFANVGSLASAIKASQIPHLDKPVLVRVKFLGKFSLSLMPTFGHLGWLRAEFQVRSVESAEVITSEYPLPDFKSNAITIDAGRSLRSLNSELLFSLFGRGFGSSRFSELFMIETRIIINNKPISLDGLLEMSREKNDGELALRVKNISRSGNRWRIQGTITIKSQSGKIANLMYDNRYRLQPDKSWRLLSLSMR